MHGRNTTNQKRYPDPGSDASSVWNFCALFSDVIWAGWGGGDSGSVAKYRLFCQATKSKASWISEQNTLSCPPLQFKEHSRGPKIWSSSLGSCACPYTPRALSPKFRKFRLEIKWNRIFRFGPTGIFGTTLQGGPLWPVRLPRSVGPKCPFPFDKIVVPSTALLYPAYKSNNQTRGGLGRVCATGIWPECTVALVT